jgi:hypothetical protein
VFVALGPAIKCAAMQNVPWTKAWGMMFLASFLVFEAMVFLRKRGHGDGRGGFEPLAEAELAAMGSPHRAGVRIGYINSVERAAFGLALLLHVGLMVWAVVDLWALRGAISSRPQEELQIAGPGQVLPLLNAFAQISVLISITLTGILAFRSISLYFSDILKGEAWDEGKIFEAAISTFFLFVTAILAVGLLIAYVDLDTSSPSSLLDIFLFFLTISGPLLLMFGLRWLCSKYQTLQVYLLMLPRTTTSDNKIFHKATWTLTFFIVNATICSLWYCFRYDPTGTVNPSWTGIFG